jgi:hypothetical protein
MFSWHPLNNTIYARRDLAPQQTARHMIYLVTSPNAQPEVGPDIGPKRVVVIHILH